MESKIEYENYKNNRNFNAEAYHQDGDLIVDIATSTLTSQWAFSINGKQVRFFDEPSCRKAAHLRAVDWQGN